MNDYEIVEITLDELDKCTAFWGDTSPSSRLATLMKAGERKAFVYKAGNGYIGGFALSVREDEVGKYGHLSYFGVRIDMRSQGIGSRILEFAYNYLKSNGINTIKLNVYKNNPSAVRFYERQGFVFAKEPENGKINMKKEL